MNIPGSGNTRSSVSFPPPSPFQRQQAILHLAGLDRAAVEQLMGIDVLRAAMWCWGGDHDELYADDEDGVPPVIRVPSSDSTLCFYVRNSYEGLAVQRVQRIGSTELVVYFVFQVLEELVLYCELDRLVRRDGVLREALLVLGEDAFRTPRPG